MTEIWKDIKGTNGKIQVSNLGNVRSLLRGQPYILKAQKDNKGYLRIRYSLNREKCSIKVHREVAKAFIPNKNNLPQVNHKDGNKENNAVSNLEWCTNQQNAIHAIKNGLWNSVLSGAKIANDRKKKKVRGINLATGESKVFESIREAERFLSSRHITNVLKGERHTVKGWSFQYILKGGDA